MIMDKETLWEKYREYINKLSNGDIFYRRDLINEFYGTDIIRRLHFSTIDVYKRCSELNGIIEVLDRGSYMKLNNIPKIFHQLILNIEPTKTPYIRVVLLWIVWIGYKRKL